MRVMTSGFFPSDQLMVIRRPCRVGLSGTQVSMMNVELNKPNIAQVPALRVKCYLSTGLHEVSFQCTTQGTTR